MSRKGKSIEPEAGDRDGKGMDRGEGMGMTTNRFGISFWGNENALKFLVMDIQLCTYTKNHHILYFMVCE